MIQIQELKDANNILDVAHELIPGLKKVGSAYQGSIRSEKTPALTIFPVTQSWCHFAGDTDPNGKNGGDVISLVQFVKGCDFVEACKYLGQRSGIQVESVSEDGLKKMDEEREHKVRLSCVIEILAEWFMKDGRGAEYLESRGISKGVSGEFKVGYSNHAQSEIQKYLKDQGCSVEVADNLTKNPSFFKDSIIIPIIQNGQYVNLYSRSENRGSKHLYLSGCPKGVFNIDSIDVQQPVYVTEAIIDSLTLCSNGIQNTVAIQGSKLSEAQGKLLSKVPGQNIVLCFDNDIGPTNPGREGARVIMKEVRQATLKDLPHGDVNDLFQNKSPHDFLQLPQMDVYDLVLSDIPNNLQPDKLFDRLQKEFFPLCATENQSKVRDILESRLKDRFKLKSVTINDYVAEVKRQAKENEIQEASKLADLENKKQVERQIETYSETETKEAKSILNSPTILYDILVQVGEIGAVGEEENILTHYIALSSRITENPISIVVKGDSSAGKSFTLSAVMKLFPKSAYIDLTDATPQSFYYTEEDEFKHRMIVIFEKHGGEKADYAIRTLQSEGKLQVMYTKRDPTTGEFKAERVERDGPTGFITTTTDARIHSENETRNLSIFPDQSESQTGDVYKANSAKYSGKKGVDDNKLKKFRCAQTLLEAKPVYIPYVEMLNDIFPKEVLRTRRDHGRFLAMIEVCALIHQKNRDTKIIGGIEYIVADPADYEIIRIIIEETLSKSVYEIPPQTQKLIEKAQELCEEDCDEAVDGSGAKIPIPQDQSTGEAEVGTFTITKLAKEVGWDRDTVSKWIKPAEKKGYITCIESAKGSKGALYTVSEDMKMPGDSFLPPAEELFKDTEYTLEKSYNPVTGEMYSKKKKDCTDAPT